MTNHCVQSGDSFPNRATRLSMAQALTCGTRFAAVLPAAHGDSRQSAFPPRNDRIETILELRAEFGDPLCIAMSADGDPTRRSALDRAREEGARLALRKPIEPWVLLRTIEGAVAG